jgi:hypothetical protein
MSITYQSQISSDAAEHQLTPLPPYREMDVVKELPLNVYGTHSSSPMHVISLFAAIAIAGLAGLVLERLVISPLAKIPGPN